MNLDEEMKLWEERANDEFGQILRKIAKATIDYLYSWKEMGIEYNVLSAYISSYALDGNRKFAAEHIYNVLENYDILGNHRNVKRLVNEMMDLANYIK